jgi:hypothetical protein
LGTPFLIAWAACGAVIGAAAAQVKKASLGVGAVLGAALGPLAVLLLLTDPARREATAAAHEPWGARAARAVAYVLVAAVLFVGASCVLMIVAVRNGARLPP